MANRESAYSEDWFKKADEDVMSAQVLLSSGILGASAFHMQQAIEKYLKGFLLSKNWKLEKIHDLEKLLDEAAKYKTKLEKYRTLCRVVGEYYTEERYPYLVSSELTVTELLKNLKDIKKMIKEIVK